jgi:CRP/FNR family cyclic AMP-dependent transcriptional regulator
MNNTTSCIQTCELFANLEETEVNQLVDQSSFKNIRKNTIILSAGDKTDSIYIIDTGKVRAFRDNEEGRQITLNTLGPGMMFGELAAMAEVPRVASIESLEPTRVLVIEKTAFVSLLERNPSLAISMAKKFAEMVHIMSEHMAEIALLDVYGRLTSFLERSSFEENGKRVVEGFTHQELANNVGASREMVSRILSGLKKGKYLSSSSDNRKLYLDRKLPHGW